MNDTPPSQSDLPGDPAATGAYQVLARKYRPGHFGDLLGQDAMVKTLTNAFAHDRIAHAFILTGVRGVGKTTTARIIAKGLNCTGSGDGPTIDPCGACDACVSIAEGRNVDVLEMDVRATADREIVVLHDATLERTTNGTGPLSAIRLTELRKLDAGYRWSADGGRTYPFRGKGIRVPALAEVFARLPQARMNIEIKPAEPAFAASLCAAIRRAGAMQRVLVASMRETALDAFRDACPEVATSMAPAEARNLILAHWVRLGAVFSPRAAALQIPHRLGERVLPSAALLAAARARNLRLHVWTVNGEDAMRELLSIGVDGIITDRPDVLLRLVGRARPS